MSVEAETHTQMPNQVRERIGAHAVTDSQLRIGAAPPSVDDHDVAAVRAAAGSDKAAF